MKYFNKTVLLSALILFLSFLPACSRIKLKQLPAMPARHYSKVHVEAHALDNKQIYDYLGFNFDKKSPLCAWHMRAYNPTNEELFITPNSWSAKPSSLDELRPYTRKQYGYYIIVGLATSYVVCNSFGLASYIGFLFAMSSGNAAIGYTAIGIGAASAVLLISSPFIIYHLINKKTAAHIEALAPQLFPIEGVIPAQSNLQGIVILPKESIAHSWQLTLFDGQNNDHIFQLNNENNHA